MRAIITDVKIETVEYTPNHRGELNRFKIRVSGEDGSAVLYLFSKRDAVRTKKLNKLLCHGNRISAILSIITDPESGGERNIAMIQRITNCLTPDKLPLTA